LNRRDGALAAGVELAPDQPAVRGLGLGVVRVRRRKQPAQVGVVGLVVDPRAQFFAEQLDQLALVVREPQAKLAPASAPDPWARQ
jgi:hypothetical protein